MPELKFQNKTQFGMVSGACSPVKWVLDDGAARS